MNIHDFFQATVDALQKYLLIHYDVETWIKDWVGVSDIRKYYQSCNGRLSNDWFNFNWTQAAYARMAADRPMPGLSARETARFFRRHKHPLEEVYLWASLCNEGFKAFCKGIHPVTDPVARNTAASLTAISRTAGWDQLLNVTWALHLCHVTGRVLWQYSGIDWDVLDMVQEGGIVDYFGQEEVDKFLRGEYPRLNIGSKQIRQVCQLFGEDEWEAKHGTSEDQSVTH